MLLVPLPHDELAGRDSHHVGQARVAQAAQGLGGGDAASQGHGPIGHHLQKDGHGHLSSLPLHLGHHGFLAAFRHLGHDHFDLRRGLRWSLDRRWCTEIDELVQRLGLELKSAPLQDGQQPLVFSHLSQLGQLLQQLQASLLRLIGK